MADQISRNLYTCVVKDSSRVRRTSDMQKCPAANGKCHAGDRCHDSNTVIRRAELRVLSSQLLLWRHPQNVDNKRWLLSTFFIMPHATKAGNI